MQKQLNISRKAGTPGHPNHINCFMLGVGGLDYHLGELNFIVHHSKYKGNCISQKPLVPQTILIIIFWDLVANIIIWENWICLLSIDNAREFAYPKNLGTAGPPNHIKIAMFVDFAVWVITWEIWMCLLTNANAKKIKYPTGPGTRGPPNHINEYTLGFGGLVYNLGELNLFAYHWKYNGN